MDAFPVFLDTPIFQRLTELAVCADPFALVVENDNPAKAASAAVTTLEVLVKECEPCILCGSVGLDNNVNYIPIWNR